MMERISSFPASTCVCIRHQPKSVDMALDKLLVSLMSRVWGMLEWLGVPDSIQGHYFLETRADELTYAPELFVQLG